MPSRTLDATGFSPDTLDFINLLATHAVRYVIIGGEAVIYHGYPRLTGDVVFFPLGCKQLRAPIRRLNRVLARARASLKNAEELQEENIIIQFGRPPNRIDLMNAIDGISFEQAWRSRIRVELKHARGCTTAYYIGLRPLVRNKRASSRPKDLADAAFWEGRLPKRRK